MTEKIQLVVDAKGLACPLPLLKTKIALKSLHAGDVLQVLATDAGSFEDIVVYLVQTPHKLLSREYKEGCYYFSIRCGEAE